jgi:hypothetical protein
VPFVYFGGSSFGLVLLDSIGRIEAVREYPRDSGSVSSPYDVVALSDGYLITGWTSKPPLFRTDAFVLKTDKLGEYKWLREYGHVVHEEIIRTITVVNSNLIILSGTRYEIESEPNFHHAWVCAIDSLGNKLWEWEANEEEIPHRGIMSMQYDSLNDEWVYVSFIEKPVFVEDLGRDVGLYAPVLVRRDSAMQLLSYDKYGPYSYKGYMGSLVKSRSGGWIAAGNTTCLTEESPYNNCNIESGRVIKLSPEGELEWSVIDTAFYNTELGSRSYLSGVTESPTGSVYAVGWANNYDSAGVYRSYGWLLKITADGCVDTLCTTTSLMEQIWDLGQKVKVYPNPATDYIVFEIADSADNLRAVVCDMQGRELSTINCGPGANVMMLDQCFSPGLYLWRVLNVRGAITGSGKFMVVQK